MSESNGKPRGGLTLNMDPGALELLGACIVERLRTDVIVQLDSARLPTDGKLAYSEEEAARLLSLEPNQLRDERRRGRIECSQIVGRRIRYTREQLLRYLAQRVYTPEGKTQPADGDL